MRCVVRWDEVDWPMSQCSLLALKFLAMSNLVDFFWNYAHTEFRAGGESQ